jgi:hypothetical protein
MAEVKRRDLIRALPASLYAGGLSRAAAATAEARAVWLHIGRMFDADPAKGKAQLHRTVQRFAEHNFNLILPSINTDYLVALENADYRNGRNGSAAWDSLGVLIEECSSAGLSVDIWYAPTEYRRQTSSDFDPRVGGDPKWAALRINEYRPDSQTGQIAPRKWEDVCLQHAGARKWQLGHLTKALQRYPKLGGVHIEEPGYTYRGNCLCDLCMEIFPKLYGGPLPDALETREAEDYRVLATSFFMAELLDILRKGYPRVVLSANGGPNWRSDRQSGRDWGRWARSGWLDYFASQVYTTNTDQFRQRLTMTVKDLSPDCPVYAGIAFHWSRGNNTVQEVMRQIEASRELGAAGLCLFSSADFPGEYYAALKSGPFRSPATLPKPRRLAA